MLCKITSLGKCGVSRIFWPASDSLVIPFAVLLSVGQGLWMFPSMAQVVPDQTTETRLRDSRRQDVDACDGFCRVRGGLRTDNALFHSFLEFSIQEDTTVQFIDRGVETILTRVTGGEHSQIEGTLAVTGEANFFLMNPNGIVFGPQSSLNIGGSFIATTANSMELDNGIVFPALPETQSLLEIKTSAASIPSRLLFTSPNPASIISRSRFHVPYQVESEDGVQDKRGEIGLAVPPQETLMFVGGDIYLQGGNNVRAALTAPGGRIELGGVAEPGQIELSQDDHNLVLDFQPNIHRSNIFVRKGLVSAGVLPNNLGTLVAEQGTVLPVVPINSVVAEQQTPLLDSLGRLSVYPDTAGSVVMTAHNIRINESSVTTSNFIPNLVGEILVRALGTVVISDQSDVFNQLKQSGIDTTGNEENTGLISINAANVLIRDRSAITSSAFNPGNAGNIEVSVDNHLSLTDASTIVSNIESGDIGQGGTINVRGSHLSLLLNGSQIATSILENGSGDAGAIDVDFRTIEVSGVEVDGDQVFPSGIRSTVEKGADGEAGQIRIQSDRFFLSDQGEIATAVEVGNGTGGDIQITADTLLLLNSRARILASAGTENQGAGNAGNITINASVIAGVPGSNSDIFANSFGGQGGSISLGTQGLFGFDVPTRQEQASGRIREIFNTNTDNDITAFSEVDPTLDGEVFIEITGVDPSEELMELSELEEAPDLTDCSASYAQSPNRQSRFVNVGRGGLHPSPTNIVGSPIITPWVTQHGIFMGEQQRLMRPNDSEANLIVPHIVEAQGWVRNPDGSITLTEMRTDDGDLRGQAIASSHSCNLL